MVACPPGDLSEQRALTDFQQDIGAGGGKLAAQKPGTGYRKILDQHGTGPADEERRSQNADWPALEPPASSWTIHALTEF